MPTVADVRSVLSREKPHARMDSVMNCSRINSMLALALSQELGIQAPVVKGHVSSPSHNGSANHAYIRIPETELSDTSSPVIVDGALDQFTPENYDRDRVEASLGPRAHDFDTTVIAKPGDDEYRYYSESHTILQTY